MGYGGFAGEFANGLGYDLSIIYYDYPSDDGLGEDFLEFGPSFNYSFGGNLNPSIKVGFLYSDEYSLNSGDSFWVYSDLGLTLPSDFSLNFHIGNQTIDDELAWGTPDWLEYNISLTKAIGPLDLAVTYSDTDLGRDQCFNGLNTCDEKILFSISSDF
ncbi:MAG: hypothetical protein ACI9XC_002731 [Gammaproteobacteria bacterium]|jgi:uncharacterized protein (TIGR02001 family)